MDWRHSSIVRDLSCCNYEGGGLLDCYRKKGPDFDIGHPGVASIVTRRVRDKNRAMAGSPGENPLHLIEQIVRGDREAFGRFYDRFAPLLFTFATCFLRVRSDAEDLLQEVFFQAWRQAGSYRRERGNPEAWLLTIARSRAIDKLRSIRRRDRSFISMEDTSEEKYEGKTENAAVEPEVGLMINSVLARLPEAQRKVLEMAYFDGLTQSEIAGRLKEPLGTVKTRMRTALGRLRESLAGKAGGDQS